MPETDLLEPELRSQHGDLAQLRHADAVCARPPDTPRCGSVQPTVESEKMEEQPRPTVV